MVSFVAVNLYPMGSINTELSGYSELVVNTL